MRKNIIALGTILGSILYAAIWTRILYFAFNYREISTDDEFLFFIIMFICFYHFGIYIIATIFRLSSKRERDIVPSVLVYTSIGGWVLLIASTILFSGIPSNIWVIILFLPLPIVAIRLSCEFEINKYTSLTLFLKKIVTVLLINLILLLVVCINDFPGVNASIEVRQKWAYEEFRHYPHIVHTIEKSNQITDKVGKVKLVAPTKGRNIHTVIGGSSGPSSEFTLEVVGEKGTGLAYVSTWGGGVNGVCFEYQRKKTEVMGRCNY